MRPAARIRDATELQIDAAAAESVAPAEPPADTLPMFDVVLIRTRREQVVELLRESVMSGQLAPGTQLVEMKLAARMGVSRGSVREAMRDLVEQGLLVSKPYGGTYVATITEPDMAELFDLRKVLERHAFRLVWPRRTEAYRAEFTRRHDELIAAAEAGAMSAEIKAEMHFHSTSYEFSGNRLLLSMWETLADRIRLGFVISQTIDQRRSFKAANARYLRMALGDDLGSMLAEVDRHIDMGLRRVRRFVRRSSSANPREDA